MWHKMLDGWQCNEGFGARTAFREGGDPREVIGFRHDGTFSIGAGGRREVPASVLAWLAAPFGSERQLEAGAYGHGPEVAGYLKDGTPVLFGKEPPQAAPAPLWPPPYPERLAPGAVLIEDATDRSDWRKL